MLIADFNHGKLRVLGILLYGVLSFTVVLWVLWRFFTRRSPWLSTLKETSKGNLKMPAEHQKQIQSYLPWAQMPLIVNGPMAGFAGPELAAAVTNAGGHGQIGSINDPTTMEKMLAEAKKLLGASSSAFSTLTLPVSVGLLVFLGNLDKITPVLAQYSPAVIWMFAASSLDDYGVWATELRKASPRSKIWIQTGSVEAALHLARSPMAKPDVLVIQGADAGGHGFEKGSGIISLLPECSDALAAAGFGHIPLLASGGIVDARGVAAALTLGASGVVMGTRFLSAQETGGHAGYKQRILSTSDGGQNTVRAKVFDELWGPNMWPVEYDGRGIVTDSYQDYKDGVDIDRIRELHAQDLKGENAGFGEKGRAIVWAGTGVGMVKKIQPAAEIVVEVREGVSRKLEEASSKL